MTEQFITSVRAGDMESLLSVAGAIINRKLVEAARLRIAGNCPNTTGISIVRVSLALDASENPLIPLLLKLEYVTENEVAADKTNNQ